MTPEEIKAEEAAALAAEEAEFEASIEDLSDEEKEEKRAEFKASHSQDIDPIKKEAERVKASQRTELEKALFKRKQIDKRISELGGTVENPLDDDDEDDSKPITRKDLREMQKKEATKTALDLAENLEDEAERDLVKHYLETKIRSSGNPQEDFEFALRAVNSLKNSHIAEEIARKRDPKRNPTPPGGPSGIPEDQFTPTAEESFFMKAPFNLSKEDILAQRKQNRK